VAFHSHSQILNETVNLGTINVGQLDTNAKKLDPARKSVTSRFGGKLHYKQLCYGSLIGLFTGVVIGKLSSVLGFITLSTVLLLQVSRVFLSYYIHISYMGIKTRC
jgi:predicted lipid-binding transport protein (Tim44 family)